MTSRGRRQDTQVFFDISSGKNLERIAFQTRMLLYRFVTLFILSYSALFTEELEKDENLIDCGDNSNICCCLTYEIADSRPAWFGGRLVRDESSLSCRFSHKFNILLDSFY